MAIVIGTGLLWGDVDPSSLPSLPHGWRYSLNKDDFGYLIAPNDKRYFLHVEGARVAGTRAKIAGLWDFIRTRGKLKWGEQYLDTRERVIVCP